MMRDRQTGALVPKFDLSEAALFGELTYLLGERARPWHGDPDRRLVINPAVLDEIQTAIGGFTDDDFLLLVGNPILIGIATRCAWEANAGRIKFLQWHGHDQRYMVVHLTAPGGE